MLDGCVLWGARVVVPPPGRQQVVQELHKTHPGIARMKGFARNYVWWPSMDADLEAKVRACAECQASRPLPASAPLHPWEWPQKPWSRLHLDYAGPFLNRMFLVLVDAHSKWLEVVPAQRHIDHVRIRYPEDLIAPNMPEALVGPEQLMARDNQASQGQSSTEVVPPVNDSGVVSQSQPHRSGRIRQPPERLC